MKSRFRFFLSFLILFLPLILYCCPVLAVQQDTEVKDQAVSATVIWIAVAFLAGLIAGGALIFLYSMQKIYSILSAEKEKYLHDLRSDSRQDPLIREVFRYIGIVGMLKKSKDKKARVIDNLHMKIADIKRQNVNPEKEYKKEPERVSGRDTEDYLYVPAEKEDENQPEIFFTIPESDGSFRIGNARKVREADCFYKIEPGDEPGSGKLHFISGDLDLRAIENIDYYLSPVCEIQNISDRLKARKIRMTGTGSVVKRGDTWIINGKDKVKIKLI